MNPTAGLSFKPIHFEQAMTCPAEGLWFEVHAENYMVGGGPQTKATFHVTRGPASLPSFVNDVAAAVSTTLLSQAELTPKGI